jgi:uncharacterized protein YciI
MPMLVTSFLCAIVSAWLPGQAAPRYPAPDNMKTVHIALLYRGPNAGGGDAAEAARIQDAHLAHITKMALDGKALIAGPIGGDGDLRGLIFFNTPTADAARALEAEDPAVKAGRLRIEMVSYMTPANWFTFGPVKLDLPMRQFVFGFLNVGPNQTQGPDFAQLMDDHLANLWSMRQAGTLVSAGPAVDSATRAGVVVLPMSSVEEARALLANDPTVKAGRATLELFSWYAADGIMKGR